MTMRMACPTCQQVLMVPAQHLGKPLRCPGCRAVFTMRVPKHPRLDVGCATSPGRVRQHNEDAFLAIQQRLADRTGRREVAFLAVVDGMGGHQSGDRASEVAIRSLAASVAGQLHEAPANEEGMLEFLDLALWDAHRSVSRVASTEPGTTGMGATAVVALVVNGIAAIQHVGDCRAYHWRSGHLLQLTIDQTLAQRMVELGQLTSEEAEYNPGAHQVRQALGRQASLEPSRHCVHLNSGDWLVLACDGLHTGLSLDVLGKMIAPMDASDLAHAMVERAEAAGGRDNCTVVVLTVR